MNFIWLQKFALMSQIKVTSQVINIKYYVALSLRKITLQLSRTPEFTPVFCPQSSVFCVVFVYHRLSFCLFSFCHFIVCPSIYCFLLPLWYMQTFLIKREHFRLKWVLKLFI